MLVTIRLRSLVWFATGIALTLVAVLLVVMSQRFADATKASGERPVFIPITPCRLVDTRPAPKTVGPRSTPLGPSATMNVNGRGPSGNCAASTIPSDATALTLNVTAVGATAQTNLRVYPAGAPLPLVSNLNPSPGAPPTPNAVTTDLSAAGQFTIFNAAGSVNVVVDVAGYFVDHNHDDRYDTKAQVTSKIAAASEVFTNISVSVPAPLVVQFGYPADNDTITTTTAGRLLITKSANLVKGCTSGPRWYFLTVDGVPVRSSATFASLTIDQQITGVTDATIPAGTHTIGYGAQCVTLSNSTAGGNFSSELTSSSVVVIP